MAMKNRILLIISFCLIAASCNSWLDITPEDTVTDDEQFKEATGFHTALNGVYKNLSSDYLYGRELSYGLADVLAQSYVRDGRGGSIKSYHHYYSAMSYDYTGNEDAKQLYTNIWHKAYFAIANANNILIKIEDTTPATFQRGEVERNLIKGEALAVRAMLHFDVLRLFAPALIDPESSKEYIPYITSFPYYGGEPKESVKAILEKVIADLEEAQELILTYDISDDEIRELLTKGFRFTLRQSSSHRYAFYSYRGYRINAMAVSALLARVYNYAGEYDKSAATAKKVVDFKRTSDESSGRILSYSSGWGLKDDRKFTDDLIFSLSNPNLFDDYKNYDTEGSNACLRLNGKLLKFDDEGDYRLQHLLSFDSWSESYQSLKHVLDPSAADKKVEEIKDMLPVIRLSEMHLILAEAAANSGDLESANEYMNMLKEGRNTRANDVGFEDMKEFKAALFSEVRREFFSEGQVFFYYKKYGEPLIQNMKQESFYIPIPDKENIN